MNEEPLKEHTERVISEAQEVFSNGDATKDELEDSLNSLLELQARMAKIEGAYTNERMRVEDAHPELSSGKINAGIEDQTLVLYHRFAYQWKQVVQNVTSTAMRRLEDK